MICIFTTINSTDVDYKMKLLARTRKKFRSPLHLHLTFYCFTVNVISLNMKELKKITQQ